MESGGKLKKFTSEEIDEQARWLVENEVIMCGTWLMDALIRDAEEHPRESPIDIEEYWSKCSGECCPECGSKNFITKSEYEDEYLDDQDDKEDDEDEENEEEEYFEYYCEDCEEKFDYPSQIEVMEYWFVDEFLAERLEGKHEVVLETPGRYIWCRQASGQAIYLDGVIQEIAKEILERRNK